MKIEFLGTKGEVEWSTPFNKENSSLLLTFDNNRVLVDFGSTFTRECFLNIKPTHILVTHAHIDHIGGLWKGKLKAEDVKGIPVYCTQFTKNTLLEQESTFDTYKTFKRADTFKINDLQIESVPVYHSPKYPAVGFIFTYKNKKVAYFPDFFWIRNYKTKLKNVNVFISDGSWLTRKLIRRTKEGKPFGHMRVLDQIEMLKKVGIKTLLTTHHGDWIRKRREAVKKLKELSLQHNMTIRSMKDNDVISIGQTIRLEQVLPGRYLVPPHARLIWEGKKKLIVSTIEDKKYIGRVVYFLEANRVYGMMRIEDVKGPYDADYVRTKLKDKHLISDEEWFEWAQKYKQWEDKVYITEFTVTKKFSEPVFFDVPPGPQRWIAAVELPQVEKGAPPKAEVTPPKRVQKTSVASVAATVSFSGLKMAEEFNIDAYDPKKEKRIAVLRHMHSKAHAWWRKKVREEPMKFTKEQIIDFHAKVLKEIFQRKSNFTHHITDKLDILTKRRLGLEITETLPIGPSGVEVGREITLEELLRYYQKPFFEKKPLILLTGGIVNRGKTKGDFEFVISHAERISVRDIPIEFRLQRALPLELRDRCHFHYLEYGGTFTSYYPLYDRVCIPSVLRGIIKLEDLVDFFSFEVKLAEIKDPKAMAEAKRARSEDKIEPMQFVLPAKPVIGHEPGERYTVESVVSLIREYPVAVQKKYDGILLHIMKQGDKVLVRLGAGGKDVTHRLPGTVEEVKSWKHPHTITLCSDTEKWVEKKYVGRELVAGYLSAKTPPNDVNIVHNVFDILYFYDEEMRKHDLNCQIGDLHKEPYSVRLRFLDLCPFKQSTNDVPSTKTFFNKTPSVIAKNSEEAERAIKQVSKAVASEGSVIKQMNSKYPLTGASYEWVKFKKTADVHAIVLKVLPTKVAGVIRYRVGVTIPAGWEVLKKGEARGKEFMDIGKTMALKKRIDIGTIVTVNFEELFYYIDPETDKKQLVLYVPNIVGVRPEQTVPDSAEEAVLTARNADLLVMKKEALSYLEEQQVSKT